MGATICRTRPTRSYVADYRPKHKTDPSFYGSQTYDAVPLIDSVVKAVNGDLTKKDEMRRAAEKADFKSVRGNFKFGPNHMPIQNFYLQDVVKDGDDIPCSRPSPPSSRTTRTSTGRSAR